jgi:hypothetical protein
MPSQDFGFNEGQEKAIGAQEAPKPMLLLSQPGIMRDGTRFQHQTYIDGAWMRFWQDKPRKMLGYKEQVRNVNGIVRNINIFNVQGFAYVHVGSNMAFERYAVDLNSGGNTLLIDRTPGSLVPNVNYLWQSDTIFQNSGGNPLIFAAATPSLNDITDVTPSQVFYGNVTDTAALLPAAFTVAAAPAGIAFAQTLAGPGNLVLNVNAPIPNGAGHVTLTTNGNLTGVNYTVTGFDATGAPLSVGPLPLPNGATTDTGATFASVSNVALSAGTGGLTVSVGWAAGSSNLTTSGGLCCIGPYLFLYGASGVIQWSVPGQPLDFVDTALGSGQSRPVSDKILKGMPVRGSSAPAGIFWSLSSLIVGNFVGGSTFWNFSTVSTTGSLLSQNGIIENNGIYYWAQTSGFAQFSGVMQDIPNDYNQQYFLDNLNYAARQKVFAFKIPRWKEIWWCFPFGQSTECNHAVIYNYDKNYWYDTPLPNGGRSAGYYDVTFHFPIMAGVSVNTDTAGYSMWQHEIGVDEVSGAQATPKAVMSFFQTHEYSLVLPNAVGQLGDTRSIAYSIVEPDYNQVGNLTLDVFSRANANDEDFESPADSPYTMLNTTNQGGNVENEYTSFQWTKRLTSFKITSNEVGGNYVAGSPLIFLKPSQSRRTN